MRYYMPKLAFLMGLTMASGAGVVAGGAGARAASETTGLQITRPTCGWADVAADQVGSLQDLAARGGNAMFVGPPGAGKAIAASALAADKKAELFRVDTAKVVSKYIGEAEKNLARIFEQAERAGAVLFFDEADALFGKRSEVKDSHDRYANIEVSYLLQRLEEYPGVVILATSSRQSIDRAFLRRFRHIVAFSGPQPPGPDC